MGNARWLRRLVRRLVHDLTIQTAAWWARTERRACGWKETLNLRQQILKLRLLICIQDALRFKVRCQICYLRFVVCLLWCVHNFIRQSKPPNVELSHGGDKKL